MMKKPGIRLVLKPKGGNRSSFQIAAAAQASEQHHRTGTAQRVTEENRTARDHAV